MSSGKACSYTIAPAEQERERQQRERERAEEQRRLEQVRLRELAEAKNEARLLRHKHAELLSDLTYLQSQYPQQRMVGNYCDLPAEPDTGDLVTLKAHNV